MTNHPNRGRRVAGTSPTPADIRAARVQLGLTQREAAQLVHATEKAWARWELSPDCDEHRAMHAGLWELFQLKTATQHAS